MKNSNEDNGNESTLHEQLCAYVLGELDQTQAAQIEEMLTRDPELQAERTRLEATIGLVTAHCSGSESLSLPALEALDREVGQAASGSEHSGRASYWGMPLQAAAGFAALAAGLLAGKALMQVEEFPVTDSPMSELVAVSEAPRAPVAPTELGRQLNQADSETVVAGLPVELAAKTIAIDEQIAEGSIPEAKANEPAVVSRSQNTATLNKVARAAERSKQSQGKITPVEEGGVYHLATGEWPRGVVTEPTTPTQQGLQTAGGTGGSGATAPSGAPIPTRGLPDNSVAIVSQSQSPAFGKGLRPFTFGTEPALQPSDPAGTAGLRLGLILPAVEVVKPDVQLYAGGALDLNAFEALRGLGYAGGDLGEQVSFDADGSDDFFLGRGTKPDAFGRRAGFDLETASARRADQLLGGCVRYPNETPSAMYFRFWGDNPFELAGVDAKSTFSVDVDTASYTLARRYLNEGHLPQKAQIRTEEFVNYFRSDLAAPSEGTFAIHTELAPSRYGQGTDAQGTRWMLRVGLRAKDVAKTERKALALTFVVDTSGSMREGNRMELVKHALRLLLSQLNAGDSIAIVAFNNSASLHLPMTSAQSRDVIEAAIYALHPDGGTNAEGGLRLGYEIAANALTGQAHNRVVLLSDGVANVGQVDQDRINEDVRKRRESGIFLNTIGVGMGNHNDTFLEQLANKGDGLCNYVDSAAEARRALVDNFVGTFEAVARDVKVQVEFDPKQVYRYRLLGYENRAIADVDFRNDSVDAGEVGAGHQVVALYELELSGTSSEAALAKVNLRWKSPSGAGRDPLEDGAQEMSASVKPNSGAAWEGATAGYRRSVLVAQFAEILRRSRHARGDSLDRLLADCRVVAALEEQADFNEFVELIQRSRDLIVQQAPFHTDLSNCIDALRRNRILRAQLEDLRREDSQALLKELENTNADLEKRIRDLIREELKEQAR